VIDPSDRELLSRYLDGDLDPDERRALVGRCGADRELAAELEELRRLRDAVSMIGKREAPPERLDGLMEPLRRGTPPYGPPTWLRGMAAAAALILGVVVVVEVGRQLGQGDGGAIRKLRMATPTDAAAEREIFQLQPLPTSSVPDEEVRIGVVDRLSASPVLEPSVDDLPALDIVGPLTDDPEGAAASDATGEPPITPGRLTYGRLMIRRSDGALSIAVRGAVGLPPGGYTLRISVERYRIAAIDRVEADRHTMEALRAWIVGRAVDGLETGRYTAELTVGAR
jgi:hypothetical protein